ncbi:(Fe-S)-binding protein [Alicyclobacillus kakegawensis]|uniref:(Fe-S)-binding protein n=1 Tax=Alicyclobacillus kakegawensis TaxID=392012 RepID=UPI00082AD2EA|nr:(Fe-S)-binding protein [Alicyclobacillus kakegawensis]
MNRALSQSARKTPAPADAPETGAFLYPEPPDTDRYSACVHCGFCLEVCPTYQETSDENLSPRGRVYLIKQAAQGLLELDEGLENPVFSCLDCRACESVCPSGVEVGALIEKARGQFHLKAEEEGGASPLTRLFLRGVFAHPRRLRALGKMLRLYQKSGLRAVARSLRLLRVLPPHIREMEAVLPQLSDPPALLKLPERIPAAGTGAQPAAPVTGALFTGCVMDLFFSDINQATARVLTRNGITVVVPKTQVCCGALHVHAGDREQARALARQNIDAFLASGADYVVVNAAGCGAALKEYPELFSGQPDLYAQAQAFARRVRDISEVLVEVGFQPPRGRIERTVTYHDACHLCHAQGIRSQPRQLLTSIPGLKLVPLPDSERCCGSAGIYNLTHPDMANRLLERKLDDIPEAADAVVMGNPGCMLQIRLGVQRRQAGVDVLHTVQLLDESYRKEVIEC